MKSYSETLPEWEKYGAIFSDDGTPVVMSRNFQYVNPEKIEAYIKEKEDNSNKSTK